MIKKLFLLLLLTLLFISTANAAYITDKLVAGLYQEAKITDKPLKALNSGTPLEVISRKNGFVQVRTSDGTVGWVESTYLTDEKPARSILLDTQARLATLQKQFEKLKTASDKQDKQAEAASVNEQQQLANKLKKENQALREKIAEIAQILNVQIETASADKQAPSSSARITNLFASQWFWIVLGLVLLVGFTAGFAYMKYRVTQRFGSVMKF